MTPYRRRGDRRRSASGGRPSPTPSPRGLRPQTLGILEASLRCPMRRSGERPSGRSGPPEGRVRLGAPSARRFLVRLRPRRAGLRLTGQPHCGKRLLPLREALDTFRGSNSASVGLAAGTPRPKSDTGSRPAVPPIGDDAPLVTLLVGPPAAGPVGRSPRPGTPVSSAGAPEEIASAACL